MTEDRPRIGIVGATRKETEEKAFQAYVEAVEQAGGAAVPIKPGAGLDVLDRVDGLVLTGGLDVDPAEYGAQTDPAMAVEPDAERDALELPLVCEAVRRDLPMLAVCRGIQVLNVALGGTLIQDVDVEHAGRQSWSHQQRKSRPEASLDATIHEVDIAPGTRLREIAGTERLGVNTFHHQAIERVAPGLVVTARAVEPDRPASISSRPASPPTGGPPASITSWPASPPTGGPPALIEAVEAPGCRWVLGVQWHPERMWRTGPAHRRLFEELVRAARAPAATRATGTSAKAGGAGTR